MKADDHVNFERASDRALKVVHTFINKEESLDNLHANLDNITINTTRNQMLERL